MSVPKLRFKEFSEEWEEKKLGEVLKIGNGKDYKNLEQGEIPVYGTGGLITKVNDWLYDGESVGIGRKGTINKPMFLTGKFWTVDTLFYTYDFNNSIPKFIYYIFNNIDWLSYNEATGVPSLSKSTILKIKSFFPNLQEQQKIADFLSSIDKKISVIEEKLDLFKEYKKGIMQKIFNQELRFKDSNGNDYPEWEEKRLEEVAEYRRGSFPQPYGLKEWYDEVNGKPFVQVYDVDNNFKLKENTKNKISKKAEEFSVFAEKGTIIITLQGSIGRVAKMQYSAFIDRTLLIFEKFLFPINKDYFKYILFLIFEEEKKKAPGGIIKTITKEALSSFIIQLPYLEEQQKIANFLSSIDKKIDNLATELEDLKKFKKGLLQQMFV